MWGLEFRLGIEEITELTEFVFHGECGCVYYPCRILPSFKYNWFAASRKGKRWKKSWGLEV